MCCSSRYIINTDFIAVKCYINRLRCCFKMRSCVFTFIFVILSEAELPCAIRTKCEYVSVLCYNKTVFISSSRNSRAWRVLVDINNGALIHFLMGWPHCPFRLHPQLYTPPNISTAKQRLLPNATVIIRLSVLSFSGSSLSFRTRFLSHMYISPFSSIATLM
jgi:hypothetical protein